MLRLEVVVDEALGDARLLGDVLDRGVLVAWRERTVKAALRIFSRVSADIDWLFNQLLGLLSREM